MRAVPVHGASEPPRASRTGTSLRGASEFLGPHSCSALLERFCKSLKALKKSSVESRPVRIGRKPRPVRPSLSSGVGESETIRAESRSAKDRRGEWRQRKADTSVMFSTGGKRWEANRFIPSTCPLDWPGEGFGCTADL